MKTGNVTGSGHALEAGAEYTGVGGRNGVKGYTRAQGHPDGSAVGVQGLALSDIANGGSTIGVLGKTFLSSNTGVSLSAGVQGQAVGSGATEAPHGGRAVGVIGDTWSYLTDMFGVRGSANAPNGKTYGVIGQTRSNANYSAGVRGVASATSGVTYGVVGVSNSPSGYGVYSEGSIAAAGDVLAESYRSFSQSKSEYIATYALESARPMIEDSGVIELIEGTARVKYDSRFLEVVTIRRENPPIITLQPYGPGGGALWVELEEDGFVIHDPNESSISVAYVAKAPKKGKETVRLETIDSLP